MISTYTGYLNLTRDMTTTLNNVASQSEVKREAAYYDANIGKVKDVDDFLDNYQLYSYAMKAYGLEDMTYAKAMMKKVLTSDLSDSSSFANQLTDSRYKEFAAAFNFGTSSTDETVQTTSQTDDMLDLYTQSYTDEADDAKTATSYYNTNIDKVKNVSQFLADDQLKDYVLKAYGIDPTYVSNSYLKSVLTSDVNDPNSFVNQNGNDAYKQIAAQFGFNSDGTISGSTAQTADQKAAVESQYNFEVPSYTTPAASVYNTDYYNAHIGSVSSITDITNDPRLFSYIKTAYGMDPKLSAGAFESVLESDPDNANSLAAVLGYTNILGAFNFQTDGTLPAGENAQSDDQIAATTTLYKGDYNDTHEATITAAASNYTTRIANVTDIDDFFKSNSTDTSTTNDSLPELYDIAIRAYGIDPSEMSEYKFKKIVESDPYDPKSYVNSLKDDRFTSLAKAFDFDSDGKAHQPVQALSDNMVSQYVTKYEQAATLGKTGAAKTEAENTAETDVTYFKAHIADVQSVSDLLSDSKLTDFILTANGIDPKSVSKTTLQKAFAADPSDSKSFLNTDDGSEFKSIVSNFNFGTDGELTESKLGTAQNQGAQMATDNLYLNQTLEEQEGDTNEGVRLALYFQRKAPDINSAYDIMGDTALYQVIQTTFSLSSSMSSMNVDDQAALLNKVIDVSDLHDPDKLKKLLQRFSAMYDLANNTASTSSPAAQILSGSSSSVGISADTLLSIAQLSSS